MQLHGTRGWGARASLLALMAMGLAACGGGISMDSVSNLVAFGTTNPPPVPPRKGPIVKVDCPEVEVRDGTAAVRSYSGEAANANLRYQFSLGDVARECSVEGDQIAIKVGVEGLVLIGPSGAPGSFTAPVRVAIRRESDRTAAISQMYKVAVTIPAGASQAPFSVVTDPLHVPLVSEQADADYTIVVGFDEGGAAPAAKVPHRKQKPNG